MTKQYRSNFILLFFSIALVLAPSLNSSLLANSSVQDHYKLLQKITLGGDGGWDYLTFDPDTRRLFISRSTHVMVVDADTGKVVGDIPDTAGVHGIAIVSELGKGFTSNGRANTVTVFDLKTLKVTNQIPVGKNPDAIFYDPGSKLIFTNNGASKDMTALDPRKEVVTGTIPLDGRPEFGVSDEQGHLYVNLEDKSTIARIDTAKMTVDGRWPLAPGEEPTGLAIDRKHHRLFSTCANKLLVVLNSDDGKIVTTLPIGSGVDAAAFDPSDNLVFSSNGEGNMTVIKEDSPEKFSVVESVTTQRGARTMTMDPKTHKLYLVTAEFGPPPAPTPERPRPRPSIVPGTFTLLILGR